MSNKLKELGLRQVGTGTTGEHGQRAAGMVV